MVRNFSLLEQFSISFYSGGIVVTKFDYDCLKMFSGNPASSLVHFMAVCSKVFTLAFRMSHGKRFLRTYLNLDIRRVQLIKVYSLYEALIFCCLSSILQDMAAGSKNYISNWTSKHRFSVEKDWLTCKQLTYIQT